MTLPVPIRPLRLRETAVVGDLAKRPNHSFAEPDGLMLRVESPTTWGISDGRYYLFDEVTKEWTDIFLEGITNQPFPSLLLGRNSVYVYIGASGVPEIEAFAPNEATQGNRICCGVISSVDHVTIRAVFPFVVDRSPYVRSLLSERNGLRNLGGVGFHPVAGSMLLHRKGGPIIAPGRSWFNNPRCPHTVDISSGQPQPFLMNQHGFFLDGIPANEYVFNRVDNGAQEETLASSSDEISSKGYGISRIFQSIATVVQLLPQTTYKSLEEAVANFQAEVWIRPPILNGFIHCTSIIHRADTSAATITDNAYLRAIPVDSSSSAISPPLSQLVSVESALLTPSVDAPLYVFVPTLDQGIVAFKKNSTSTAYAQVSATQTLSGLLGV